MDPRKFHWERTVSNNWQYFAVPSCIPITEPLIPTGTTLPFCTFTTRSNKKNTVSWSGDNLPNSSVGRNSTCGLTFALTILRSPLTSYWWNKNLLPIIYSMKYKLKSTIAEKLSPLQNSIFHENSKSSLEKVFQKCFWQVCNFLAQVLIKTAWCLHLTGIQYYLFETNLGAQDQSHHIPD